MNLVTSHPLQGSRCCWNALGWGCSQCLHDSIQSCFDWFCLFSSLLSLPNCQKVISLTMLFSESATVAMADTERSRSPQRGGPPPLETGSLLPSQGGASDKQVCLYVGNLSYDMDETCFSSSSFNVHGTFTDIFLPRDSRNDCPRGFSFVSVSASDADRAVWQTDGSLIDGRPSVLT